MNDANEILESGILEAYVLGHASASEQAQVERYILQYPAVAAEFEQLQESLEAYAMASAVAPPAGLRDKILGAVDSIDSVPNQKLSTPPPASNGRAQDAQNKAQEIEQGRGRVFKLLSFAASAAAVLLAVLAFNFWQQKEDLKAAKDVLEIKVTELELDTKAQQTRFASLQGKYELLADPNTQKFLLKGNDKANGLKTLAYHNTESGQTYVHAADLPKLPDTQCYQMWADVHGEMVSVAVLDLEDGLAKAEFFGEATSFNITIEPAGGNDHATVANLVASVAV